MLRFQPFLRFWLAYRYFVRAVRVYLEPVSTLLEILGGSSTAG